MIVDREGKIFEDRRKNKERRKTEKNVSEDRRKATRRKVDAKKK